MVAYVCGCYYLAAVGIGFCSGRIQLEWINYMSSISNRIRCEGGYLEFPIVECESMTVVTVGFLKINGRIRVIDQKVVPR